MEPNEMNFPPRPGVPVYVDNHGNKQTRDESYSADFWQKQPDGLKEEMQKTIADAIATGIFYSFAGGETEIDEKTKEKLSAYRILAEEMGYIIGPFDRNKNAGTVQATISKKE